MNISDNRRPYRFIAVIVLLFLLGGAAGVSWGSSEGGHGADADAHGRQHHDQEIGAQTVAAVDEGGHRSPEQRGGQRVHAAPEVGSP